MQVPQKAKPSWVSFFFVAFVIGWQGPVFAEETAYGHTKASQAITHKVADKDAKGTKQGKKGTKQGKKGTKHQHEGWTAGLLPPMVPSEAHHDVHGEAHGPHGPHFVFGVKFGAVEAFEQHEGKTTGVPHGGGGGFAEISLLPHHLELELGVYVVGSAEGTFLPIELLLKVPLLEHKVFAPYVGLGPIAVFSFAHESAADGHGELATQGSHVKHNVLEFAMAAAAGSYFWFNAHWGVELEVNAELLFAPSQPIFALGLHTGLVFRP